MALRNELVKNEELDLLFGLNEEELHRWLKLAKQKLTRELFYKLVLEIVAVWLKLQLNNTENPEYKEIETISLLLGYLLDDNSFKIRNMGLLDDIKISNDYYNDKKSFYSYYEQSSTILYKDPYKSYYINPNNDFPDKQIYQFANSARRIVITDQDMLAVVKLFRDWSTLKSIFVRFEKEFMEFARGYMQQQYNLFGNNRRLHHKLLTTFCRQWATQHGFNGFVKMPDGLSRKQFGKHLMNGILFDDIAFRGTAHGALGHFMQWVAIIYHYEDTHFLRRTPAELYAWIGLQERQNSNVQNWFDVFEFGATEGVFGMNKCLLSDQFNKDCPLLSEFIRTREEKAAILRLR